MNGSFVKLISLVLVIVFLSSCMTITPDNRDEAVVELARVGRISRSISPMVNTIGPTYTINALTNDGALMVAGQLGLQLGYNYFTILDRQVTQHISGSMYRGTGGITTTSIHSITVAFTNDESLGERFLSSASSALLDGHTFTTRNGRIASWSLFGTALTVGTIVMLSALSVDYDDPRGDRRLITGGVIMGSSLLFTIPLFW